MKLTNVKINSFRSLESINLNVEEDITLIVGKNNTGKTSLFEVINIFTSESAGRKLSFADFSQSTYKSFENTLTLYKGLEVLNDEEKDEQDKIIDKETPRIEVTLSFQYNQAKDKLTDLKEFIVDLDKSRTDVNILMTYEPKNLSLFYTSLNKEIEENKLNIIKALDIVVPSFYEVRYYAIDSKSDYKNIIDKGFISSLSNIVMFEDIRAQRVMDDVREDSNHSLTTSFAKYYEDKDQKDKDIQELDKILQSLAESFKIKYNDVLQTPLNEIAKFGAKTPLVIPDIIIESVFSAERVLKQNIKYGYKNGDINLPESYNGLGYSNLIFMILEFLSFLKLFEQSLYAEWDENRKIKIQNAKSLVIMIEEPESHMHPQMQQVFIRGIKGLLKREKLKNIDIQIIITTHSSHVIAESGLDEEKGFQQLRYFGRNTEGKHFCRDFNKFKVAEKDKDTFQFLRKYLTLHKCDLFFADKVIMVEGLTERLLLPIMIQKVALGLQEEYITLIEVGGAYAHKFKEFLEFIQIKTLIITDLDSAKSNNEKCSVRDAEAVKTSNAVLKEWLPAKENLSELISCASEYKILNGLIRVAYQNSENGDSYVGRSFEEAFIRINKRLFDGSTNIKDNAGKQNIIYHKNLFGLFKRISYTDFILKSPDDLAPKSSAKSNFAFDILSFDENTYGEWKVPNYIKEGLEWLAINKIEEK